ncbi:MAG TPA: CoA-transferase [bacterium]|nr:CoA-transferase [bacterium]
MKELFEGRGELFTSPDPDLAREHFRKKDRALKDKVMSVGEAVEKFIPDGTYFAAGGFGGVRIPTAVLHEIVRRKRKRLGFCGHSATHTFQILAAGDVMDRCDISYVIGLEARGVSPNARRLMESKRIRICEWSNASLTWRIKAAALGIPFLIGRQTLGADSIGWSASKIVECPYTGKKFATYPALYPDVAIIHVNEADPYGNSAFRGISNVDEDLARASKHVIITCERLVGTDTFRNDPHLVRIPYFCVDAVCEVPYGSYPGNMPFEYFSDEKHIREWLTVEKDEAKLSEFLQRNIYGCRDHSEYVSLNGGLKRMQELRRHEFMLEVDD